MAQFPVDPGVIASTILPPPFPFSPAFTESETEFGTAFAQSHGGNLPDDPFWRYLQYRHDIAPARFDFNHPTLAALLDRNSQLQSQMPMCPPVLVPNNPTWRYLEYRHDLAPARFDEFHPGLARRLDQDQALREANMACKTPSGVGGQTLGPPGSSPGSVLPTPEPSTALLGGLALTMIWLYRRCCGARARGLPVRSLVGPG